MVERYKFEFIQAGAMKLYAETEVVNPVSVQQVIQTFFAFLEATGVHPETINEAADEVVMDRYDAGIKVEESPFSIDDLQIVEDDGFGIGV